MKKVIFAIIAITSFAFASCVNTSENTSTDSSAVYVDSTSPKVDTLRVDTLAGKTDSASVDTSKTQKDSASKVTK